MIADLMKRVDRFLAQVYRLDERALNTRNDCEQRIDLAKLLCLPFSLL